MNDPAITVKESGYRESGYRFYPMLAPFPIACFFGAFAAVTDADPFTSHEFSATHSDDWRGVGPPTAR
jgi:uncharacterized membrane protein